MKIWKQKNECVKFRQKLVKAQPAPANSVVPLGFLSSPVLCLAPNVILITNSILLNYVPAAFSCVAPYFLFSLFLPTFSW